MSTTRISVALIGLLAVAGCSQGPIPFARLDSEQPALAGFAHWQELARFTAQQIAGCLDGLTYYDYASDSQRPYCPRDATALRARPLYVELTDSSTIFSRTFHDYLTTALIDQGRTITLHRDGALLVRYRVEVAERDRRLLLDSTPGPISWVTYTAWAADNGTLGALAPAGLLGDLLLGAYDYGGAQVTITTSLMDGERYVTRKSDGYFIADTDIDQFRGDLPPPDLSPPHMVSGEAPAVTSLAVVGE